MFELTLGIGDTGAASERAEDGEVVGQGRSDIDAGLASGSWTVELQTQGGSSVTGAAKKRRLLADVKAVSETPITC